MILYFVFLFNERKIESRMKTWLLYSISTTVLWGIWGVIAKLSSRSIVWQNVFLLTYCGYFIVFPIYFILFSNHFKFLWRNIDCFFAIFGGIISSIAALFFYFAISEGESSKVVTITALYPVLTVILAYLLLHEPITVRKLIGVGLAIGAIYFLQGN